MCDFCIAAALSCLEVFPEATHFCRAECLQQLGQAFNSLINCSAIARLDDCSWCVAGEEYSGTSAECSIFAVSKRNDPERNEQ